MKFLNKKGFSKSLSAGALILGIITLIVGFEVLAVGVPLMQTSGDTLCATGVPLAAFFGAGGIVFLIVMAGVLLAVLGIVGLGKGR